MAEKLQHFVLLCIFGTILVEAILFVLPWSISQWWVAGPIMFTFGFSWPFAWWGPEEVRAKFRPRLK